ncbi:MAG: cytochrome c biogenesis protein ResB, partial [Bacteroidota bacterium]
MKKILNSLFSMQLTVVLLMMFAISAAVATFIENDFGTTASKVVVYNATWFEILMALLAVNLGGSLVVNRMWQKKKYTIFAFHIAFIIILIGAAITRYHGFEGMMHIRQGETAKELVSDRTYISAKLPDGTVERQGVLMSGAGWQAPDFEVDVPGGEIEIETIDFVPNAAVVISQIVGGEPVVSMFAMTKFGRQNLVLKENDVRTVDDLTVTFSDITGPNTVNLSVEDGQLHLMAPDTVFITSMGDQQADTILPGVKAP